MGHFELIKLSTDALLVAAVCFLSFRILASGSLSGKTAQLMILEASLKGLIKDAEGTGRSLNDELQKRQYSLERLLGDLEGIEKRVSQVQRSFDESRSQIDGQVAHAQNILAQMTQSMGSMRPAATHAASVPSRKAAAPVPVEPEIIAEETPEPPSFETMVVRSPDERHKLPERRPQVPMNKAAEARHAAIRNQRLAAKIEREVEEAPRASRVMDPQVERTVAQVESAASDVRKISEQVETLSEQQVVPQHIPQDENPEKDPRLGVLGGMKRQIQTL